MTNKELVITTNERFVHFNTLVVGDYYRSQDGGYYIKIEYLPFNSINLITGSLYHIKPDDNVIPIKSAKISMVF